MKHVVLMGVLAFLFVACGGDDTLSETEFVDQGNLICAQMFEDLEEVEDAYSSDLSEQDQRDLGARASVITQEAIEELFALAPPTSMAAEQQQLVDIFDEQQALLDQVTDGQDVLDQVVALNQQFEDQAERVWPGCTQ